MKVLEDKENHDAIAWKHGGTQFSIRDRRRLCSEILPNYLERKTIRYDAFVRRLRRWKFNRTSSGSDTRIYNHPVSLLGSWNSFFT